MLSHLQDPSTSGHASVTTDNTTLSSNGSLPRELECQDPPQPTSHVLLPLGSNVSCRLNNRTKAGKVVSVPSPSRPFCAVTDPATEDLEDAPPLDSETWARAIDIVRPVTSTPNNNAQPPPPSVGSERHKITKRNKLEFAKLLPTNRDSCMTFHDSAWIFLASCEWDTPSKKHLLEHKETDDSVRQLSRDAFHALCRGTTSPGTPATSAFPILTDIANVGKGIECHWTIFEEFCPLADHQLLTLRCEFNCLLQ